MLSRRSHLRHRGIPRYERGSRIAERVEAEDRITEGGHKVQAEDRDLRRETSTNVG